MIYRTRRRFLNFYDFNIFHSNDSIFTFGSNWGKLGLNRFDTVLTDSTATDKLLIFQHQVKFPVKIILFLYGYRAVYAADVWLLLFFPLPLRSSRLLDSLCGLRRSKLTIVEKWDRLIVENTWTRIYDEVTSILFVIHSAPGGRGEGWNGFYM